MATLTPNEMITGVYLPVLMWFFLGIPLAIYTGIITSRLVLFQQELQRARERVLHYTRNLSDVIFREDYNESSMRWTQMLFDYGYALKTQGQGRAANQVFAISARIEVAAEKGWKAFDALRKKGADAADVRRILDDHMSEVGIALSRLMAIKPNYFAIGLLRFLHPPYLQLRRKRIRFVSRWRKFSRYLSGESYGW